MKTVENEVKRLQITKRQNIFIWTLFCFNFHYIFGLTVFGFDASDFEKILF